MPYAHLASSPHRVTFNTQKHRLQKACQKFPSSSSRISFHPSVCKSHPSPNIILSTLLQSLHPSEVNSKQVQNTETEQLLWYLHDFCFDHSSQFCLISVKETNTENEQRAFCYVVLTIQDVCNSYSRHVCKLSFPIIDLQGQYDTKQNTFTSQFIKYAALTSGKLCYCLQVHTLPRRLLRQTLEKPGTLMTAEINCSQAGRNTQ